MFKKNPLITGTLILTATGFLSRIIGFFYRIFLSQTIGEEGMGIYQLLGPVMALSFSITSAGIQTTISRFVATEPGTKDYKASARTLLSGLIISLGLSFLVTYFLYNYAGFIAANLLLESRCEPLVKIYALSLPFASIHCCINGYYYGIKKTGIPAISQLLEQGARVLSVYAVYLFFCKNGLEVSITISVIGLVIGDFVSMIFSGLAVMCRFKTLLSLTFYHTKEAMCFPPSKHPGMLKTGNNILKMAVPLSGNRLIINFLHSIESIYIPNKLVEYGLSNSDALRVYGVLSGMVMPLILFPTALTGSISVLLLPYIAEAQSTCNYKKISAAVSKCVSFCLVIGFLCSGFFLIFSNFFGTVFFDSAMAASFLRSVAFICPFMYLRTILSSVVHGLGQTGRSFIFQIVGSICKLAFVFIAIPLFGIQGYLWGLLASEVIFCLLYTFSLRKYISLKRT